MSDNTDLTYYQKKRDVVLIKAKYYYKNNKDRLRRQARDKYRSLSEQEKNQKREYGKIDIVICLKKRKRNQKNTKKIIARQKSLNILINK